MLTDLSFLDTGKEWPPPSERKRLDLYRDNRALFEGRWHETAGKDARRVQQIIGDYEDKISYELLLNYQQLVSKKVADLMFSEWPTITSDDEDMQGFVDDLIMRSALTLQCYEAALDVSRYGDGTLGVAKWDDGVQVYVGRTDCWFPVVDPSNIKRRLYDVIAIDVTPDAANPDERELHIEIHGSGTNEVRKHRLAGGMVGPELTPPQITSTGLAFRDFWQITNVATSDSVHGLDDYTNINSLVEELQVRFAQIAKVLDKFTEPVIIGPESALSPILDSDGNPSGYYEFRTGNFIINRGKLDQESADVKFGVWDASLDAAFTQIDRILGQVRTVSELGALLSDTSERMGQMPTGAALRTLLTNAIAKVARIRMTFDPVLKQAIKAAAAMAGITPGDVSIKWFDGLPENPVETAQILQMRTGGKQTLSIARAIMDADGMTAAEAEAECETIQSENTDMDASVPDNPYEEPDDADTA